MLERTLWLVAFSAVLLGGYLLWTRYWQQQTRTLALAAVPAQLAGLPLAAGPAILYFTTATCAQCRLQQTPALARLQQTLDPLQVIKLDAVEHSALADFYHVMTVPTTIVLDATRRPVAINHGVATTERLLTQLEPLTRS
ncbi:MAG: thioredoxin family protein [Anaerolineae bacterium]